MKKHFLIIFCFLLLLSCKKEDDTTQIRILNGTGFRIDEITIHTGSNIRTYMGIKNGKYSNYQPVGRACRYASGEAVIEGNNYICQIIDYVGEKELGAGKFTYEATLYDVHDAGSLVILLKK